MHKTIDHARLGKRVRAVRRAQDITQEQLAEMVGVSTSFIGHIERNTRILSVDTLYNICVALGVSADELMGLSNE